MKSLESFIRMNKIEGNIFISFDLSEVARCDEIACKGLEENHPDYVLPLVFDCNHPSVTMRYSVPDTYKAITDDDSEIQIEDVLCLYQRIFEMLEDCEDCFLQKGGFCLEASYVFVNVQHDTLKFLYVPEKTETVDLQGVKYLMISILEKCAETSGGKIQLQLYKYFYKPKFSLEELKTLIEQIAPCKLEKKEMKELSKIEEQMASQKAEVTEKNEISSRPYYVPKVNRTQLSQEEIEAMVQSVYEIKELDSSVETQREVEPVEESLVAEQFLKGSTEGYTDEKEENKKENSGRKRYRLDKVFMQGKNTVKSHMSHSPQEHKAILKSISVHARYNLPKAIEIDLVEGGFIIGRATRTGEPTGAQYEFGTEITPISKLHAKIERKEDNYYLQDLGSSNGTFLNGTKIEANKPYLIEDGDKIAFAIAYSKNSIEYIFVE